MANKGGRPTKYRKRYCDEVVDFIGRDGRSVVEFAAHLEVTRETVYEWARVHEEFSDALSRAQEYSEAYWHGEVRDMMHNPRVNAPLAKLYLAQRFGWSDKQKTELTGASGGPVEISVTRRVVDADD